jgi:uncharacterized protein (TIGR00255 family)
MTRSMTAFSSQKGSEAGFFWSWELRSVNGKGLDLRLRVPDWVPGLEAVLRVRLGKALARGNVTLNLRLSREETGGTLRVNAAQLSSVLEALQLVEDTALARGMTLAPSRAADLLGLRGVLETGAADEEVEGLAGMLLRDFEPLLADFIAMRAREGAAIDTVLLDQVAQIEVLVARAAAVVEARAARMGAAVQSALARVVEAGAQDPQRIAQELALIAIKADVTEELDRLRAHISAARDLLAQEGTVGRKLDFLSQEFNREANTLCAKAQDAELTTLGLELKAVIDQLREQVQNIE